MSITAICEGNTLRIIESSEPLQDGVRLSLYTKEEVDRLVAEKIWAAIPPESRESMLLQTQSATYEQWMAEEEWDTASVLEETHDLDLADFNEGTSDDR